MNPGSPLGEGDLDFQGAKEGNSADRETVFPEAIIPCFWNWLLPRQAQLEVLLSNRFGQLRRRLSLPALGELMVSVCFLTKLGAQTSRKQPHGLSWIFYSLNFLGCFLGEGRWWTGQGAHGTVKGWLWWGGGEAWGWGEAAPSLHCFMVNGQVWESSPAREWLAVFVCLHKPRSLIFFNRKLLCSLDI